MPIHPDFFIRSQWTNNTASDGDVIGQRRRRWRRAAHGIQSVAGGNSANPVRTLVVHGAQHKRQRRWKVIIGVNRRRIRGERRKCETEREHVISGYYGVGEQWRGGAVLKSNRTDLNRTATGAPDGLQPIADRGDPESRRLSKRRPLRNGGPEKTKPAPRSGTSSALIPGDRSSGWCENDGRREREFRRDARHVHAVLLQVIDSHPHDLDLAMADLFPIFVRIP